MNEVALGNWINDHLIIVTAVVIWDVVWKGLALWRAAKAKDTGWFIGLLIINSVGILPILYLVLVDRKRR